MTQVLIVLLQVFDIDNENLAHSNGPSLIT